MIQYLKQLIKVTLNAKTVHLKVLFLFMLYCNIDRGFYPKYEINSLFIDCYNYKPIGYYLDKENKIYSPCYSACSDCDELGDEYNHKCLSCASGYHFIPDFENDINCYKDCCYYYYYFDINKKYQCTSNYNCPDEQNKKIINKFKCIDNCIKDKEYKYESGNKCYKECPIGTHKSEYNAYSCEKDLNCEHFCNYNRTECIDNIPEGYFLNDSYVIVIVKYAMEKKLNIILIVIHVLIPNI